MIEVCKGASMQEFIDQIMRNLSANGFPAKRVSLPTERMYEAADDKGLNFNKVLEVLEQEHQVFSKVETERIIFFQHQQGDGDDLYKKAQEAMAQMSPEQLQQMQQMFMNMSEEEKAEIMRKGKEMGLI